MEQGAVHGGLPVGLRKTGLERWQGAAVTTRSCAVPSRIVGAGDRGTGSVMLRRAVSFLGGSSLLAWRWRTSSFPSPPSSPLFAFLCFLFPSSLLVAADGKGRNSLG
jgi:hypothetical protein